LLPPSAAPRQRAALLLCDALGCPSNVRTKLFLSEPTIPDAFQLVDWHQLLYRFGRGSKRIWIRKLRSTSTERRLRRIFEQKFEDSARWFAQNLADHGKPKIDASCHAATRRPISIDYISSRRAPHPVRWRRAAPRAIAARHPKAARADVLEDRRFTFQLNRRTLDDDDSQKGASGLRSTSIAMAQSSDNRRSGNPVTDSPAHAAPRELLW
jgi:hypothetical protein